MGKSKGSKQSRSTEKSITKKAALKRQALDKKKDDANISNVESTNQFGDFNKALFILVRVLQYVDLITGVLLLAYGITLRIGVKQAEIGVYFIILGATFILSSTLAFYGFRSPHYKRLILRLSAYVGLGLGITDWLIAIGALIEKDDIFDYLKKHNVDFYLTNSDVTNLKYMSAGISVLLIFSGLMEFARFYAITKIRADLVEIETIVQTVSGADDPLTEPLLDDAGSGTDTDSDFAPVDGQLYTDGNWWADKNQFQDKKDSESDGKKKRNSWMNKAATTGDEAV